ncbi:hypothetical protein [Desulfonispora thiosulfatigenes]|nr:hypothetical protein [Desulfonispora thiosulfatigenes]
MFLYYWAVCYGIWEKAEEFYTLHQVSEVMPQIVAKSSKIEPIYV